MKNNYDIVRIDKSTASVLLENYHYLSKVSKGFKSGFNYGLMNKGECFGVAIFTGFPVPELAFGLFGLQRGDQDGLFELSRLCIHPDTQKNEYNITSWFLSRAIKKLRKDVNVRAILSYADADYHTGTIYRACNFKYYGLSDEKKDFYMMCDNGEFVKKSRGKVSGLNGEWRKRSRKHRFLITYCKNLTPRWTEVKPQKTENNHAT